MDYRSLPASHYSLPFLPAACSVHQFAQTNRFHSPFPFVLDDDARVDQLQNICMGQKRVATNLETTTFRRYFRFI